MIISHKHKFIFIKTEKTAGTSIEIALSKICGPKDIITRITPNDEKTRSELGYPGPQNYLYPLNSYGVVDYLKVIKYKGRIGYYNHISAAQIKERIPADIWNSYFKFTFERNPFDKLISWYYWTGGPEKHGSVMNFIQSGRAGELRGFDLYSIGAIPAVDKVYKFEELKAALVDISDRLGLDEKLELPKKKAKGNVRKDKRHYKDILNEEEIEWISKMFAREIAYFGYQFEGHETTT